MEGEGREQNKQANPEPPLIREGRDESRERKEGVGEARNAQILINLSPSQFY